MRVGNQPGLPSSFEYLQNKFLFILRWSGLVVCLVFSSPGARIRGSQLLHNYQAVKTLRSHPSKTDLLDIPMISVSIPTIKDYQACHGIFYFSFS